ncbi:uridine kinase [candidate division KSB1 bacterium]|nr:uridine kinase [candidate division KSB1 bacterium]
MPITIKIPKPPQERPLREPPDGPHLIGICGGSGSGKTLVARSVARALGPDHVLLIEQDSYYKDLSEIPLDDRNHVNFDHPTAFDTQLMIANMRELLAGRAIQLPLYDYTRHARAGYAETFPRDVILIDGILIFEDPALRDLMDIRVYVDTEPDVRLARRIRRDISERGRTLESVLEQYELQVRPMHDLYVEPYKKFADVIIPQGGLNKVAVDMLVTKVRALLRKS